MHGIIMSSELQLMTYKNGANSSAPIRARFLRRLKPDLCRLATFRSWKTNTQSNVSPVLLSKVGFSYSGKNDKVRCEYCELEIDNWKSGMDPKQEHMERRPQCPFVLNQQEIFSRNGIYSM